MEKGKEGMLATLGFRLIDTSAFPPAQPLALSLSGSSDGAPFPLSLKLNQLPI